MAEYKSKYTGAEIDTGIDKANAALSRSGGTMTGPLTLAADPTANMHPATKQYVDNTTPKNVVKTVNGVAPDANGNVTVEGGGGGGGSVSVSDAPYELIEEYVIPEGGLTTFRRTAEPDGTPYSFKAIRVKTQMATAGAATVSPNFIARNGEVQLGNMYIANMAHTGGKRFAIIETFLERGEWVAYGCTSATSESGTISRYLWAKSGELKESQYSVINHLYCAASFPAGLKIIIEAVRA